MQKSTKHGIIAVVIVFGIAGGIYYFTKKKGTSATKEQMINEIITNPASNVGADNPYATAYGQLASFGDDYIKAWYDALKGNKPTFEVAGRNYHTGGGKSM